MDHYLGVAMEEGITDEEIGARPGNRDGGLGGQGGVTVPRGEHARPVTRQR